MTYNVFDGTLNLTLYSPWSVRCLFVLLLFLLLQLMPLVFIMRDSDVIC